MTCTSATICTAVGYYLNSLGHDVTLAETWNGVSWSLQHPPNRTGDTGNALYGVACTSASACIAVGSDGGGSLEGTLTEVWNGTAWSIRRFPNREGALNSVACAAAACVAVGFRLSSTLSDMTLAEGWNGTSWSLQTTKNRAGGIGSELEGVTCTSPGACSAVGYDYEPPGLSLGERWNGSAWSIETTANPSGSVDAILAAVACTSTTSCTAVGYYHYASSVLTLAETWNGTTWSIQTTPALTGSEGSTLTGVACPSASYCMAVGTYDAAGTILPLAETWNGTSWLIQTVPYPSPAIDVVLNAVACTSTTACTAVGNYQGSSGVATLAENWNGSTWTIQTTPNPASAAYSRFYGVACTSATACTAVGSDSSNSGSFTLAEAWDGTSWTIKPTPAPTGAVGSVLSAVACPSAAACTAVGYQYGRSAPTQTLAEVWDGNSWTVQSTPNPAGASDSRLDSVTCTTTNGCIAVGRDINGSHLLQALAETQS